MRFLTKYFDYSDPNSLGTKLRKRRIHIIKSMISEVFDCNGSVNIIDMGGRKTYWNNIGTEYLLQKKCKIILLNMENIDCPTNDDIFEFVLGDACKLPYDNKHFDIAHSNSVIEHVGNMMQIKKFALEAQRVAHRYYIQTPNFWFPFEPHFMVPAFHWLPKCIRTRLILMFNLGHLRKSENLIDAIITIESANLLTINQMGHLFYDGTIHRDRFFCLTKSIIATK